MGATDNKKICCEAATASKIQRLKKAQHRVLATPHHRIGEKNVFLKIDRVRTTEREKSVT